MIILYIFCAISLTLGDTWDCCGTKKNGDTIYKLVKVDKDITKRYNCKDGCIYEDTNEDGSRFCFRYGGEHNSTCDVGETESVLTISENGQEVKQAVSFNNYTGILTIDVPPHISVTQENFTQATTTFDTKTNTNVIKSNNSCVLSDIPDYINVTGMPEYFQQVKDGTVVWDNENKEIAYDVKMVKSVVSPDERKALTPALDSLCNNQVIKKTQNKRISKENYKKLMNNEIIFIGDESENRQSRCSIKTSCTSNGPASCGNYGWYNPELNQYITMHQVSSGSLCITCCVETSPQCNCAEDFPEFCPCSKITTKEIFMDCLLDNGAGKYKLNFQDSVRTLSAATQLLTYNSKTDVRSVKIEVPSHGDVSETTVLMHAHTSGMWHTYSLNNNMMMKVGSTCYIRTLPQNVFPVDIATGIKDIDAGNFAIKPENEKKKHTVIRTDRPLTSNEKQNLNPEIIKICKNSEILKYEEMDVGETEFQTVNDGGIINLKNNEKTRGCSLETRATTNNNSQGCWRWPNPNRGQEISVHGLVSSVVEVKCCNDPCCKDSGYCECKDITDFASFYRCFAQTETPNVHVDCYNDPLGEGKCPENAGCFNDELGQYGPLHEQGFCHCYLGFYWDSSTNPPTCKDMRGGGNCDENGNSHICYENDRHFEWCPYCSVKKVHEDHGGELSLGHYVSGEGDYYYDDDPQIYENGDAENCPGQRSTHAYWYCWYDTYVDIVPLDIIIVDWMEPEICSFFIYAYTPLACCFADPNISDPSVEC